MMALLKGHNSCNLAPNTLMIPFSTPTSTVCFFWGLRLQICGQFHGRLTHR